MMNNNSKNHDYTRCDECIGHMCNIPCYDCHKNLPI